MIFKKYILISLFLLPTIIFAANQNVDNLLEKVNQAKNTEEKKELIEELKEKLAKTNKKAREESDAIIKAKKKIPLNNYNEQ